MLQTLQYQNTIVKGISSPKNVANPIYHFKSGQITDEGKLYFFTAGSQIVSWIDHVRK